MQVVPLGPKRVKLSEINNFKNNWQNVQRKKKETIVNTQRAETLEEVKAELN